MWYSLISAIIVVYLPGALVFRIPSDDRWRRSELRPEERTFWAVVISVAISSTIALALAALDLYRFDRLLLVNVVLCVITAGRYRQHLRWDAPARRLGVTALAPAALVCVGLWLYFPPSEYIIGGKDPGVYMNQGIQIAQRGSLVTRDDLIASLPAASRDLFILRRESDAYYGLRFMGYFVTNPDTGRIVGQFPHLYPIWIAIGYGVDGLTGARQTIGVWESWACWPCTSSVLGSLDRCRRSPVRPCWPCMSRRSGSAAIRTPNWCCKPCCWRRCSRWHERTSTTFDTSARSRQRYSAYRYSFVSRLSLD